VNATVEVKARTRAEGRYRFDVVGVLMDGARVLVKHVEDAF